MKKKYIKPECSVIEMEVKPQLLAGSNPMIYEEETDQIYGY